MDMTQTLLVETESTILINLLLFTLGVIATVVIIFVRRSTNKIKDETTKLSKYGFNLDDINFSIEMLENIVVHIVQSFNQTVVDDIRKKSADGHLTIEEASEIKNAAIERIMNTVSGDLLKAVESVYGDPEAYIAACIESTVYNINQAKLLRENNENK